MHATSFEYRLRYPLHLAIYLVGFWPFWEPWLGLSTKSSWLTLSAALARQGWLAFQPAVALLLVVSLLFAFSGWAFRVWGTAYLGSSVVQAPGMHGAALLADGPYRHTRNPLYLGTLLHTVGIALLMPPAGAVFTIAAIWILQVRLALAEEPFLTRQFGEAYRRYMERVPRFLPSPRPLAAAAGVRPHWGQALLGEIYFLGVVVTLLLFGWSFNATPLLQGILISLGLAIIVNAFLPRTRAGEPAAPQTQP